MLVSLLRPCRSLLGSVVADTEAFAFSGNTQRHQLRGGSLQGGAEWALSRRDHIALGLSEIPQTARQRDTTSAGRARAALALTAMPKHLPCRDAERKQISQFLEDVLCTGVLPLQASDYLSLAAKSNHDTASILSRFFCGLTMCIFEYYSCVATAAPC